MKELLKPLLLFVFLFFISCSNKDNKNYKISIINGVKHIRNKNIPSHKKIKLKLEKKFSLKGFDEGSDSLRNFSEPFGITIDSKNNIYIADFKTSSIKKFSINGKFLKSIGRKGSGPGEADYFSDIMINNDTLFAFGDSKEINKFDLNGKFLSQIRYTKKKVVNLRQLAKNTDSSFIAQVFSFKKTDKSVKFIQKVGMYNYKMDELVLFCKKTMDRSDYAKNPYKFSEIEPMIAFDNEKMVYVAYRNKEKYIINGYNLSGDKKIEITKNYRKIPIPKSFREKMRKKQEWNKNIDKTYDFKPAILDIAVDKSKNLWIQTEMGMSKPAEYDIFNEKGVYIAKYSLDLESMQEKDFLTSEFLKIFFKKDLMLVVDYENVIVNGYTYSVE